MWEASTVTIHRVFAFLLVIVLYLHVSPMPDGPQVHLLALRIHVIAGLGIIALLPFKSYLTLKNFIVNTQKRRQKPKSIVNSISNAFYVLLYTMLILLAFSAYILFYNGIFSFAFLGGDFPEQFYVNSPIFELHALFGIILIALLLIHTLSTVLRLRQKGTHNFPKTVDAVCLSL